MFRFFRLFEWHFLQKIKSFRDLDSSFLFFLLFGWNFSHNVKKFSAFRLFVFFFDFSILFEHKSLGLRTFRLFNFSFFLFVLIFRLSVFFRLFFWILRFFASKIESFWLVGFAFFPVFSISNRQQVLNELSTLKKSKCSTCWLFVFFHLLFNCSFFSHWCNR